jgi:DNA repair protein RadD
VASIQTLMRRWGKYPLPDLIIVDECHHACSASWSKLLADVIAKKPDVKIIGLTATPQRLDGRGLAQWFEVMVEGPNTAALMEMGYLAKYRMWGATVPDLTGVHSIGGDYNKGELNAALSRTAVVGDALAEYRKHCDGMRALAFTWSVKSSEELAARFRESGIAAMHVDGDTDSAVRDKAIRDFHAGRIKLLSNVELFSEGLDVHGIQAEFLLRPTQSLAMYLQQVGRGLRTDEGKDALCIFDHAGHQVTHGYPDDVRTWTLDGNESKPKKPQKVPVRQCQKCYATVSLSTKICKWCGTVFEIKPRKVELAEGELREVSEEQRLAMQEKRAARQEQGMADTYEALLNIERNRGYKPGWARLQWMFKLQKRRGRKTLSVKLAGSPK